jgi:1-acyl-sn-glycerol-3-phosphate acyltransferase
VEDGDAFVVEGQFAERAEALDADRFGVSFEPAVIPVCVSPDEGTGNAGQVVQDRDGAYVAAVDDEGCPVPPEDLHAGRHGVDVPVGVAEQSEDHRNGNIAAGATGGKHKWPAAGGGEANGVFTLTVHESSKADRPESRLDIRLLRAANVLFARGYHKLEVLSPCRLPPTGAAILVCNHISGLDPLFIQSVCSRVIVWMMAKEFYDIPSLNWIFRRIEAIPVERSGRDVAATRAAMRALKRGRILGVFPEGRIERTKDLMPFQTGAAMLARRSGAPVYTAYLDGTQRNMSMTQAFGRRQEARIRFGGSVDLGAVEDLEQTTARLQEAVEFLRRQTLTNSKSPRKGQQSG